LSIARLTYKISGRILFEIIPHQDMILIILVFV